MTMQRRVTAVLTVCATVAVGVLIGSAQAEIVQRGKIRVDFEGQIAPRTLPRDGTAPIRVTVGGRITTSDRTDPPQLREIRIAINRNGRIDYSGLPVCRLEDIQPATTANALRACGDSKVGEGTFGANVVIPEQSPFPSNGKVIAFSGRDNGKPVIFAHVYGTEPVPISYTLPLRIGKAKGQFSTVLTASLPAVTSDVAFVTGISLTLDRRYRSGGRARSYVSAGCPAPAGFPGAVFPLVRASFDFGKETLTSTLTRSCKARG